MRPDISVHGSGAAVNRGADFVLHRDYVSLLNKKD
jgi:hypothetical protein